MTTLSLRARLTLWYTVALLVVLCLFGANVLWQQRRIGFRRVDRELEALTATLVNVVQDELNEQDDLVTAATEATAIVTAPGRALAIADAGGKVLGARWNRLELPDPIAGGGDEPSVKTIQASGVAWRVHTRPHAFGDRTLVLVVASPVSDVLREQREVQEAMVIGIPIVLLLAAAGGLWLASFGLRPITDMAVRAARIAPTGPEDLGQTDAPTSSAQLATAFNGTRRAASRDAADAASVHGRRLARAASPCRWCEPPADVALSRDRRDESEYREALAIVGGQAGRLGRLVEDMLVLARADAGGYPLRPVNLYLDEVVAECRRAVDVLATERGVAIRAAATPAIPIRRDLDLLRRPVLRPAERRSAHADRRLGRRRYPSGS
jgi:signal transduction histidine kinase